MFSALLVITLSSSSVALSVDAHPNVRLLADGALGDTARALDTLERQLDAELSRSSPFVGPAVAQGVAALHMVAGGLLLALGGSGVGFAIIAGFLIAGGGVAFVISGLLLIVASARDQALRKRIDELRRDIAQLKRTFATRAAQAVPEPQLVLAHF